MARHTKNLTVRDEFLILTNGEKSEKNYFESIRALNRSLYKIHVKFYNDDPVKLIDHAISEKNKSNHVWCVFDKDQFPDKSIYDSIRKAKDNEIGIAFSNISFEVWLIDHFCLCKDEKTEKQLEDDLNKILHDHDYPSGYNKNDKEVIDTVFMPRLEEAVHNSDIVRQKYIVQYHVSRSDDDYPVCKWNSFTNVNKLIEALKLERKCSEI